MNIHNTKSSIDLSDVTICESFDKCMEKAFKKSTEFEAKISFTFKLFISKII